MYMYLCKKCGKGGQLNTYFNCRNCGSENIEEVEDSDSGKGGRKVTAQEKEKIMKDIAEYKGKENVVKKYDPNSFW